MTGDEYNVEHIGGQRGVFPCSLNVGLVRERKGGRKEGETKRLHVFAGVMSMCSELWRGQLWELYTFIFSDRTSH